MNIEEVPVATFADKEAVSRVMPAILSAASKCEEEGKPVSFSLRPNGDGSVQFCATQEVGEAFVDLVVTGESEDDTEEEVEEEEEEAACEYCHCQPCFWLLRKL